MNTTEFLKLFEEDEMDFSGQDLHDIDLECLNIDGLDFSHANLRNAHLQKASLETTDLRGTCLAGTDFRTNSLHVYIDLLGEKLVVEEINPVLKIPLYWSHHPLPTNE
jgi:uncharacterized protein YjbI with pentapeptide repeats